MRVIEIFESIDGEVNCWGQGTISTFIRFAGCNLNCSYCDTKHSQNVNNGMILTPEQIVPQIKTKKVTITGGEPLLQNRDEFKRLLDLLAKEKKILTIETNGTFSIMDFQIYHSGSCSFIVDYKLDIPNEKIKTEFVLLYKYDFINFPIQNKSDYDSAKVIAEQFNKNYSVRIAFSPIGFNPEVLLNWMLKDRIDYVALNVQLHKLLNLK